MGKKEEEPTPKRSWAGVVLAGIVILSAALMLNASLTDSGIMDELAHIPSGYSYVHNLDYRLNPEHPPLLKALAALPLLFLKPAFPADGSPWTTDLNPQWDMGNKFLYQSGNNPDTIINLARIMPMILTLLTILLIYAVGRSFFGPNWALLPAALFALSPSVLAHGHYVTTDIAATFGILLALYAFLGELTKPSRQKLIWAGVAFGIAQLLKFSAVLLAPYMIGLVAIWALFASYSDQIAGFGKKVSVFFFFFTRKLCRLILIFAVGYALIVYPVYFLFTRNYPPTKQTADTEQILISFAHGPTPAGKFCQPVRCLADATIWATKNPITRPIAHYALGVLMVVQRSAGGNSDYFNGVVSNTGSVSYFPTVFALKETIPTLIFILFGVLLTAWFFFKKAKSDEIDRRTKVSRYFENNFGELALFLFLALYWFMSMRSTLNIGFRHLMPTVPLFYLLLTGAWKKWFDSTSEEKKKYIKIFIGVLLAWFVAETAYASPYFLSYFNEIGGGVNNGYKYVTDSNYDWGQDFLRFRDFVNVHPEIDKIAVDYFGAASPEYYLPGKTVGWWSAKGDPRAEGIHWFAVSINSLAGALATPAPYFTVKPEDQYKWLEAFRAKEPGLGGVPKPDYRIGTTIFIYRMP